MRPGFGLRRGRGVELALEPARERQARLGRRPRLADGRHHAGAQLADDLLPLGRDGPRPRRAAATSGSSRPCPGLSVDGGAEALNFHSHEWKSIGAARSAKRPDQQLGRPRSPGRPRPGSSMMRTASPGAPARSSTDHRPGSGEDVLARVVGQRHRLTGGQPGHQQAGAGAPTGRPAPPATSARPAVGGGASPRTYDGSVPGVGRREPRLDEATAARSGVGDLAVADARPGRQHLRATGLDDVPRAGRVGVDERALEHPGDDLQLRVRVLGIAGRGRSSTSSLWQTRGPKPRLAGS